METLKRRGPKIKPEKTERVCGKCKVLKPISEFYGAKRSYCKKCTYESNYRTIKRRAESDPDYYVKKKLREKELGYSQKWCNSSNNTKNHENRFPEKRKAREATRLFVKTPGFDLHHWNYNDDHLSDVIELPITYHRMVHRFLIYVPDFKIFKTNDGVVLDSKEKHSSFINKMIEERIKPMLKVIPLQKPIKLNSVLELNEKEQKIIILLAAGKVPREMQEEVGTSEQYIRIILTKALKKLGCKTYPQLCVKAFKDGLFNEQVVIL